MARRIVSPTDSAAKPLQIGGGTDPWQAVGKSLGRCFARGSVKQPRHPPSLPGHEVAVAVAVTWIELLPILKGIVSRGGGPGLLLPAPGGFEPRRATPKSR